jgi:hypothetical protein
MVEHGHEENQPCRESRESRVAHAAIAAGQTPEIRVGYRRTQINVKRPGVQAFYRSGYMARRP